MANLRTSNLIGWQDKNNKGDNGFFPCPKEIVLQIMKLIKFNLPKGTRINVSDFVGGLGDQLYTIQNYLLEEGLEPISFYNEMMIKRFDIAKERYGNVPNFNMLNTDFFFMKLLGKDGNRERKNVLPLIYANPPYFDMEFKGETKRSEEVFFLEMERYNCVGGVLLYVVRQPQLASQVELMRKITYRYENIEILRFPTMQELSERHDTTRTAYASKLAEEMGVNKSKITDFDQVVVIGKKKRDFFNDREIADLWIEKLMKNNLKSIFDVIDPVIEINEDTLKHQLEVNVYRDKRVSDVTLTNGLLDTLDDLLGAVYDSQKNIGLTVLHSKPIIELTAGNITNKILSGGQDGLNGGLLIKGSTVKDIVTLEEEDENTGEKIITDIEKLSPCISALNVNGDRYSQKY